MNNDNVVDYVQAVREFDKSQGKKPEGFDMPLRSTEVPGGGVDYLKVSREYVHYLEKDGSEIIHRQDG